MLEIKDRICYGNFVAVFGIEGEVGCGTGMWGGVAVGMCGLVGGAGDEGGLEGRYR